MSILSSKKSESLVPMPSRGDRMSRFFEDMIRTFDEFPTFGRRLSSLFKDELGGEFVPRLDIREDESNFIVTADLPGMSKDDVKIDVTAHAITIHGEKKDMREEKKESYHLLERSFGEFSRTLRMPLEIDPEKASAVFKDGVLTAVLPKMPKSVPEKKTLEIKTES
jgi:HSP20 family protein